MNRLQSFFVGAALVGAANGMETAVLDNSTQALVQWGDAANWTDDAGSPRVTPPVSDVDVSLPTWETLVPATVQQTLTTGSGGLTPAAPVTSVSVRNIEGDARYHVRIGDDPTIGRYVTVYPSFSITCPDLFTGYWTFGNNNAVLTVDPTASTTAKLAHLESSYMPTLSVPDEADTAEVGLLTGNGLLLKTGAGSLAVKQSGESDSRVDVSGGALSLGGNYGTEIVRLLASSALHLDASLTNTLHEVPSVCGDDFTSITQWDDVRGNGAGARASTYTSADATFIPFANPPYRSPVLSQSGLPLVDFGARGTKPAEYGTGARTNCVMELICPLSKVREAFYAVSTPFGGTSTTILGGKYRYDFLCEGTTLFASYAYATVVYGDTFMNGEHCAWNRKVDGLNAESGVYVVSVGTTGDATVELLASRQYYRNMTGNVRIGEVLLFTNVLTKTERACVNRYLTAKWVRGVNAADDLGNVVQAADAPLPVAVPADNDVRIGQVTLKTTGKLVKSGTGKLTVGALSPSNATVRIEGGSVAFAKGEVMAAVAEGAYLWLDAEKFDSLETSVEGSVTNVLAWKDCRADVTRQAVTPAVANGKPTVIESCAAVGGRRVLSFENTKAWMTLPTWKDNVQHAYAGFVVLRPHTTTGGERPIFGSSTMEMYRGGVALRSPNYPSANADSANWTINARPISPYVAQPEFKQTEEFLVLAFTSQRPILTDAICKDRAEDMLNNCGLADIGEYILYHRPISVKEFQETEAYLMQKWLGRAHPLTVAPAPAALEFAETSDAVLDFAADAKIATVSGGTGAYVKRSEGAVSISLSQATNNAQTVMVEAGTLIVRDDLLEDALFRFDALDAKTLVTTVEGEGVNARTNVVCWTDPRENGLVATCDTSFACIETYPKLLTVETTAGVIRPTVDFGKVYSWTHSSDNSASGLKFNRQFSNVRECFAVFADANGTRTQAFFGDAYKSYLWDFYRDLTEYGYIGALAADYYMSPLLTNGYIAVDGVPTTSRSIYPTGMHVIAFQPTGDVPVSALAQQGSTRAGGCRICEQIGFSQAHTPQIRAYIEDYLQYKWLGKAEPAWPYTYASVAVKEGASFSLPAGHKYRVACVTGSGIFQSGTVFGVSRVQAGTEDGEAETLTLTGDIGLDENAEIAVTLTAEGTCDQIVVNGRLDAAGGVTVSVAATGKPQKGDYRIVSAATLEGVDLSRWTLAVPPEVSGSRVARLYMKDNSIWLHLDPLGLAIIVR